MDDATRLEPVTGLPTLATLAAGLRHREYRSDAFRPGARLGKYEIVRQLGAGGFSAIYEAKHTYIRHRVALKTMRHSDPEGAERFLREARVMAALSGDGVVRVYDVDLWEGFPYIALELIEGGNLSELLRAHGRLSLNRVFDVAEEMTRVLVRQHSLGIVHRDIKPHNICMRSSGDFCLLDYGLVGASAGGRADGGNRENIDFDPVTHAGLFGTPLYMSPEQWDDPQVDHRSDLFSLGITLWECLCGQHPRKGGSFEAMGHNRSAPVGSARAFRPDVPKALETILCGMLAIDKNQRYDTPAKLLRDIEAYRYRNKKPWGPLKGSTFVAIPFSAKFEGVFEAVEVAAARQRLRANRMDRIVFVQDIWNQLVQEIDRAQIVIADFTAQSKREGVNPNVITEAAHARAKGKPLILISQNSPERLPFDWRHMPVLRYSSTKSGLAELVMMISDRIRELTILG